MNITIKNKEGFLARVNELNNTLKNILGSLNSKLEEYNLFRIDQLDYLADDLTWHLRDVDLDNSLDDIRKIPIVKDILSKNIVYDIDSIDQISEWEREYSRQITFNEKPLALIYVKSSDIQSIIENYITEVVSRLNGTAIDTKMDLVLRLPLDAEITFNEKEAEFYFFDKDSFIEPMLKIIEKVDNVIKG